jgi:hypothetical protein
MLSQHLDNHHQRFPTILPEHLKYFQLLPFKPLFPIPQATTLASTP